MRQEVLNFFVKNADCEQPIARQVAAEVISRMALHDSQEQFLSIYPHIIQKLINSLRLGVIDMEEKGFVEDPTVLGRGIEVFAKIM